MVAATIVPSTRTQLIDRYNHVPYAKVASTQGTALGPLGAVPYGNASLYYSTATPLIGGTCGQVVMNAAGSGIGAKLLEATLPALQMGVNTTYTASLYINSPVGGPNPQLLIGGTGVVGNNYSVVTTTKGAWTRISVTFTTTATTTGLVSLFLIFDSAGFVNAFTLFDALQIDDGGAAVPWFDGSGPLVPDPTWLFGWVGTAGSSLSKRYVNDPSEVITPQLVLPWSSHKDVGNVLHRLLSNQLAVTRRQPTMSIGTIVCFFADRLTAYRLYSILDRLDTFVYTDPENPETNLTFVTSAKVAIDQDKEFPLRWLVAFDYEQTA